VSKAPDNGLQLVPAEPPKPAAPLDDEMKELLRDMKERRQKSINGSDHEPPQAA